MMEFDRQTAELLNKAYEGALNALAEVEYALWKLPAHPEREEYIRAHTGVVVSILSRLRAPLLVQFRDLDTDRPEGPPDTELDDAEQLIVSALTAAQVALIDKLLLAECSSRWRKVARVVGFPFLHPVDGLPSIPVGFLILRVQALVAIGQLESQGSLDYMRFSEVRLKG